MNIDFTYENPTRIHFGRTAMQHLPEELNLYGRNILLVYGKNSIKASGLYDQVVEMLRTAGKEVHELSGINSNPRYSQVLEGARMVREHRIDLILAVGGGSVIDCCKAISAAAYCDGDPWERYWMHGDAVTGRITPIGTILTMTGTASEMNSGSVITNEERKIKQGRIFPMADFSPRFSILNPEFTYSVPRYQMVSGIFDIFSHLMEQYFGGDDDCVSDYLLEGDMRALISASRAALRDPYDYEARSNIMWCATMGLNKILAVSKIQDWEVHQIEHQLGAYTDCAHGIGLAIISVPYYRHIYRYGLHRFVRYARNIWDVNPDGKSDEQVALEGIDRLSGFIAELGIPQTLREVGATEEMLPLIAASANKTGGYHVPDTEEVLAILRDCF
ncbi:MAG: Fe-dependent oxidoreductase, alcohol dehydrogenase [bacterium P3]|nr:MAG: Fe-dependent oxidoreductase, alcohol dehydrogenase [bacterium P3]KWW42647.1 MAG: Fe-dependent oxidoreductase, alcohol dehydrogenase [bacterium F083]